MEKTTRTPCLEEMLIADGSRHRSLGYNHSKTENIPSELKSELVNFSLWMKREGYSPKTIRDKVQTVRRLAYQLGTLLDGDAVKDYVAGLNLCGGSKLNVLKGYHTYCRWKGFSFQIPKVQNTEAPLPFIPLENELDALIAGSGRKLSTILLTLKETGARVGEVLALRWEHLDPETGVLNIQAEKGSYNRQTKLSPRLVSMILRLPKKDRRIFPNTENSLRTNFGKVRRRLANKLENARLLKVHFHSFRHWYATKTYWQTKDILYTKKVLGHRRLDSTLRYTQIVDWKAEDSYHSKAVRTTAEAEELVSQGWEYVCEMADSSRIFRKRK